MSSQIVRTLVWYEKAPGDALVGEAELTGADLPTLQRIFGVPASDPMYACWPVGQAHVERLQCFVNVPINLDEFDYFVECHSVTNDELVSRR